MQRRWHRDRTRIAVAARLTRWLSTLALLLALLIGTTVAAEDRSTVPEHQLLVVAVNVNAQPVGQGVVVLRSATGDWWLPAATLRAANVAVPEAPGLRFNETEYIALSALGAATAEFDEATQSLDIRIDAARFSTTRLSGNRSVSSVLASRPAGAFLNYDLMIEHTPVGNGHTLYTDLGVAVGGGMLLSDFLRIDRPGLRESIRLSSSFTLDQPDRVASLRIGDAITRPPTSLGRTLRFGGLQWSTNFQTRPGLVTVPVATLSGQAALPSTIDLYVNNVLQGRNAVPPGPFSISTPPLVAGDGEVLLKLTDLSGQEQLISQRYYASTVLLAPGLSDYSFEIGALRQNYGLQSDDYGDAFISGSWRQGLSERLTIEAGASLQQHGLAGLLASVATAVPDIGIGTLALGLSHGDAGTGAQLGLGVERRTARHSFSARMQIAGKDYRQTGVDPSQAIRRLDSLFYGYRIGDLGSLGLSYTRQQRMAAQPVSIASASLSSRQYDWGSLGVSLIQSRADRSDISLNLFWAMTLGRGTSASAFHAQPAHGESQQVLNLQKNMEPGEGWGYRLQAARNAAQQASVYGQNAYGFGRLEVGEAGGQTSVRAGVAGGVALLDGHGFLSRRIDGSYGLVRMPGFANVRVYVDNQLAARTNADGYALLPRLYPYMKNGVSIEQMDVPLDAQIDTLRMHPVPAWRSGVLIDFPVRPAAGATLELKQDNGWPVPAGTLVTLDAASGSAAQPFVVGHDGLLYLSGLQPDNRIQATWPGGQCAARFPYVPEKGSVPHLGTVTCSGSGGAK